MLAGDLVPSPVSDPRQQFVCNMVRGGGWNSCAAGKRRKCATLCETSGSTADLANNHKSLEFLRVAGCKIEGSIAPLAGLENLTRVYLGGTDVHGRPELLSGMSGLEKLDIRATNVQGSVRGLRESTRLGAHWMLFDPCTGTPCGDIMSARPFALADAATTAAGQRGPASHDFCCSACQAVRDCGEHAESCTRGDCVCSEGFGGDRCDTEMSWSWEFDLIMGVMAVAGVSAAVLGCRLLCRRRARQTAKAADRHLLSEMQSFVQPV